MGRKCSVVGCKTGYKTDTSEHKHTIIYGFPSNKEKCREWVASLPNVLDVNDVTGNMGVCAKHWPDDVPLVRSGKSRHAVPSVPPSIFPNVPKSCLPSSSHTTPRPTKKSTQQARVLDVDQLQDFLELDSFKSSTFNDLFINKLKNLGFVAESEDQYILLSRGRTGPVASYSVYFTAVHRTEGIILQYEAYNTVKRIHHAFLKEITCWSQLDEVLRFVTTDQCDSKSMKIAFINRIIQLENSTRNTRIYSHHDLLLSFTWFSQSRALYMQLREYLQLPSISTLKKITAVAKNRSDEMLFSSVFSNLHDRAKFCILIIDEVYIKASISYRGGVIFDYAVDNPGKVATTLLCIMVKCFFGGPTFLAKILPCHALNADFQYRQVCNTIAALENCSATVVAVVNDNNRVNQSFFKKFEKPDSSRPWKAQSPVDASRPLFLLYDTVHLLKNVRNNWLSEKTKTLELALPNEEEQLLTARWSDLEELYQQELRTLLKLSTLTKASLFPTNIEKQKVSLALNVISEKTSAALTTSSGSTSSWKETSAFIGHVIRLWKVFNTKTSSEHVRICDPDRAAVDLTPSGRRQIDTLMFWSECANRMKPKSGQRIRSLTLDTASALNWTCKCLAELCDYLLSTESVVKHQYVAIGFFQQDDLEHHFAHFRMSAGCNYYINAQDAAHTHAIDRAKLMLQNEPNFDYASSHHSCNLCAKPLSDTEIAILDDLPDTVNLLSHDERMSVFYIGGYIASKHSDLQADPSCLSEEIQTFMAALNRGGLSVPSAALFQFILFSYSFFKSTPKQQNC